MKATAFAVHHHVAVLFLCFGILLIGSVAYRGMPREDFPDIEFPFVIVTTVLDGADPTDVEESVTIPLETELDGVEGLKEMRSASMDSTSMISLEFHPGVDKEEALRRVKDAVDQAKPDISAEAEEPVVKEFTVSSFPVLIYHIVASGGGTSISELDDLAEILEDRIKSIPGVLEVEIYGTREREIVIEVDPERLHFYDLSIWQVMQILQGTNRNVSAGTAESDGNRVVMRVPGEFESPADIFTLVIGQTSAGVPIYMRDVANVRYDFEDEESRARLYDFTGPDGVLPSTAYAPPSPSVSIQIKKRTGINVLELCRRVDETIARQALPSSVRIVKGFDSSKEVNMMVSDLENGIATSLILVLAVIFLGLGAMNAVLVAAAIPFSMLLSIIILRMTGETLNMMVLFSLIMSLGMLVDNAIVIVENIYRHVSLGLPRAKAALVGTSEVAWPVITSTATTVAAFTPLLFWPGIMGEFMSYLPRTIIVVLLASLFVALIINPTLAALFMRVKKGARRTVDPETERPEYWLVRQYRPVLEFMLDRPAWTLATAGALLVLVLAAYGSFGAGVELFPPTDPNGAVCSIKPPEGISLAGSDRLCQEMEARLFGAPGSGYDTPVQNLKYASVTIGLAGIGGGFNMSDDNSGPVRMQVEFVDREYRTEPTPKTLKEMRNRMAGLDAAGNRVAPPLFGAEFDVLEPQNGPPTGAAVSIDIFGEDLNEMTRVITDMKRLMDDTPGTLKPTDDAVTAQPTLEWQVDRARAGVLGLDQATISSILQVAVGGLNAGTFGHGDDERDIMIRLPEAYRLDTDRLKTVTIPMATQGSVPITSVATAELIPGPVTIKHYNKMRVLNASADVERELRRDADIRKAFRERVEQYPFPPGITYRLGGAATEQAEAQSFLLKAFVVAVFLILMVMVLEFNSMIMSGIVMASVILSFIGVFSGLLVMRAPFGIIMTGIGVISLAGVVVNNAIVLLDAIRQFENRGHSPRDSVISASMIRFRPVLLTAVTTILGLVPMAAKFNWDFKNMQPQFNTESSQWWQSMALTVIFGLLLATILTLGVVPSLYLEYAAWRIRIGAAVRAMREHGFGAALYIGYRRGRTVLRRRPAAEGPGESGDGALPGHGE